MRSARSSAAARRSYLAAHRGLRFGAGLLVASISVFGVVHAIGNASATERQEVANISREAYFTRPASAATPPLLRKGFPPSTACLVAGLVGLPQVCGEAVKDLGNTIGVGDGLPVPETIDSDLVQPVLPGTMPVGMAGGQERYTSLIQFGLPTLPTGQQFGTVELLLQADGTSYAAESPAFRELVLAAVNQVEEQDPTMFADVFADVASGETAAFAESVTGIEACPTIEAWGGGDAQNAGIDGARLPDVNCVLGTTGVFDADTNTWVFDITFAAQAWTTGGPDGDVLPNEGIMLRPLGAQNLAYGDPDVSTNWMVSLADADAVDELKPRIRYSTVPATTTGGEPGLTPSPAAPFEPPATGSDGGFTDTPIAANPPVAGFNPGALRARYVENARHSGTAGLPGWLWLLILFGLFGAWLMGESVLAAPETIARRAGALDRLVRLRGADTGGPPT
jgi:hypothetical protein